MIVTCQEMREIEERTFATGTQAEALMDRAGAEIAIAVRKFFPNPAQCLVVFGKGHNGGDALVAARHLAEAGWAICLDEVYPTETLAPLTRKKLEALQAACAESGYPLNCDSRQFENRGHVMGVTIILDGLLGIGAKPGLREPLDSATCRINRLRREMGATVFAIDIPTGLDGDTGVADPNAVMADFTLTIGFAKRGLVTDSSLNYVGRLAVLPLAEFAMHAAGVCAQERETVATPEALSGLLPVRRFGTHKGDCGRVGIVAGSRGFTGAAIMAANAAVRSGAGLVSLFVMPDIYTVVAASAMPEIMVTPTDCYLDVLERHLDVLAIGPGLGREDSQDLLQVIEQFSGPMVVDADALNLLADGNMEILKRVAGPRLLTPHPGEMARLFPESSTLSRRETAKRFLERFAGAPLTLLLKGSRTLVAERASDAAGACLLSFNSTGNPGMATGGMGDVLTGTCAALAGQGLGLFDAACVGAWICGRAAEIAISHGQQSQESLAATDLLAFFGHAFSELHRRT